MHRRRKAYEMRVQNYKLFRTCASKIMKKVLKINKIRPFCIVLRAWRTRLLSRKEATLIAFAPPSLLLTVGILASCASLNKPLKTETAHTFLDHK